MTIQLSDGYKANFNTLQAAMLKGDAALLSVETIDGQPRTVVCAVNRNKDGSMEFLPLAVMVWDDPFQMFKDPAED